MAYLIRNKVVLPTLVTLATAYEINSQPCSIACDFPWDTYEFITNLVPFLIITASCSSSFNLLHWASRIKNRQSLCQRSGSSHGSGTVA